MRLFEKNALGKRRDVIFILHALNELNTVEEISFPISSRRAGGEIEYNFSHFMGEMAGGGSSRKQKGKIKEFFHKVKWEVIPGKNIIQAPFTNTWRKSQKCFLLCT